MEDHDILVGLEKDMSWLKKIMGNHLKHHWAVTITMCSAVLGLITALIILLVKGI